MSNSVLLMLTGLACLGVGVDIESWFLIFFGIVDITVAAIYMEKEKV